MSTDIANLVCRKTDRRIKGLAEQFGLTYTRFVDDITFSGDHIPKAFQIKVKQIIGQSGYKLNPKKEDLLGRHQSQIVTGLSVNRKRPKVPKKVKRKWRMDKYLFEKYEADQLPRQLQDKKKQKIYGRENYVGYVNRIQTAAQ